MNEIDSTIIIMSNKECHRKMWEWMSKQTFIKKRKVDKKEYFNNKKLLTLKKPLALCYACEEAYKRSEINKKSICDNCPIKWDYKYKDSDFPCTCSGALYMQYNTTDNWKEATRIARKISELKWN